MEKKKLIEFRNIVKNFDGQIVLKGVNLDIYEKEFVTLLGPSGCGKSTTLRILGGFLDADEGSVIFDGEEIDPTWKPFEYYSPWLEPLYGGDFLICPYPVSPYPPTNIKEGMTYCRYRVQASALREDINGYLVWLVNYVVGREGMYCVELQTDATHSLTPVEGTESETNKAYSGQVFRR